MNRRQFLMVTGGLASSLSGCQESSSDATPMNSTGETATATNSSSAANLTPRASLTSPEPRLFTGAERVFVVNGYSTSFDWPDILQRKLERYFDGDSVITVKKALKPATPIVQWMNPESGESRKPWKETLKPSLDSNKPVIVLAQQSLQGLWGDFQKGIRGSDDTERIETGANVLEQYASRLQEDGADHVYIATHIYKHPSEPVIGNERLALDALLNRDPANVTAGPDVWQPTKKHWPKAFQDDKVHPNQIGAEIMAHHWFSQLLASDQRDVPGWSQTEMEEALAE